MRDKIHMIFGTKEDVQYVDRKGAYLIPVINNSIGVVQTSKGYFFLGGGLDNDETDEQCIVRECLEEAGYTVVIKRQVCSAETYTKHPTIGYFHPIQTYYLGELDEQVNVSTEEDHKLVWLDYSELKGKMYLEMQNWALEQCWKNRSSNISQTDIITINESLRLRKYDGNYEAFLPAYQDPYIYQNSEGIFNDAQKPDLDYVKRMCDYLEKAGEFYFIEAKENDSFIVIGDVTVKADNPPIAIWFEKYRGIGIGTAVMKTVISRLKELGVKVISGSTVYKWNLPSQKMHEKLGFKRVDENEKEFIYELDISSDT